MSDEEKIISEFTESEYKWGFVTDIEEEDFPKGLNEDIIREISKKKNEPDWLTDWRLKAYKNWQKMVEPKWPKVKYPEIDFQDIRYYSAPKKKPQLESLDEVDPDWNIPIDIFGTIIFEFDVPKALIWVNELLWA